jgi:hypothetical protein
MHEKRSFSRVGFRVSALLQSNEVVLKGEVKDVSLHGLYLETEQQIPLGTPVEITIYLSDTNDPVVINVSGSVARNMPGGLGCVFEKIDVESFAHLRSVISYQTGDESRVMAEFAAFAQAKSNHD